MVTLIRSDLEFILQQILISEAHATKEDANGNPVAGTPLINMADPSQGLLASPQLSFGLRTVDGSYNNLYPGQELFGTADQLFPRLLTPYYRPESDFDPDGPTGPAPTMPGAIIAPELRDISNLIVDISSRNAAAVQAAGVDYDPATAEIDFNLAKGADGIQGDDPNTTADESADDGQHIENLFIGNVAPDEGLSAGFNSWMTLFGQFFDHGLDLINKGGNNIVFVPLREDDPLYNPASPQTNFMILTRATETRLPGEDGILGNDDDTFEHTNQTTPFVDQNQTYTSHSSHQVFLREYAVVNGVPVATGNMLDGNNGGLPTWADVKAQALMLGIQLTDADVTNVPLLATDEYGRFLRGPNGYAQLVMAPDATHPNPWLQEGTAAGITTAGALKTGHAFLDDIAHNATPTGKSADVDTTIDDPMVPRPAGTYDNELLDAHKITGDGRGNENIGLTAVHHVFHSEHNRLVEHIKQVALDTNDPAFIQQWLVVGANMADGVQAHEWDGERLFQAARFGTEMQYQHLVFEEFARKIQPNIGEFIFPIGYQADINPAIFAEYAHAVYRFGHSMLTESIDRLDPNFQSSDLGLIDAFLNPVEFDANGTIDADIAAGAIVRGMTRQLGSEIDEFVTGAVRNNLLGLPLDLATINLARGRDTGIPTLNEARAEIYAKTGDSFLKPYESWADFAGHLKNEMSIINFIAAYGLHSTIVNAADLAAKRAAAWDLITSAATDQDAFDFLNSTGAWARVDGDDQTGLDDIDLWIGGLAEEIASFGGMLGSTFNYVFELQLERLQDADRFYYLQRLHGMNFLNELEQNSFANLIMRNTDVARLPGDVFSTPGLILEVDQSKQFNLQDDGLFGNADPTGDSIVTPLVIRNDPSTPGTDTNYLRYTGDDHVVLGGTSANDKLIASIGDDTVYGDGGNDRLEGGHGNDIIRGGDGDDIITDAGGDDTIHGEDGNDVINAGSGVNLVIGGGGSDFIITGQDGEAQTFGGRGNDFIFGNTPNGAPFGNEGDDWIEGGTQDGAAGDNEDPFGQDPITGNDVFHGDGGFDEYVGEGGDDMMFSSLGLNRMEGGSGFDWAIYRDVPGTLVDLLLDAFDETPLPPSPDTSIDRYAFVEGVSGSHGDDRIFGDNETDLNTVTGGAVRGNALTNIALISGLQSFLGAGITSFSSGNILLGGDGNDIINGRAGDDLIDGDKWLNARISVRSATDPNVEIRTVDKMAELIPDMLAGTYNPGQLQIVREMMMADGSNDTDTAVFTGNLSDYTVTQIDATTVRVIDNRGIDSTTIGDRVSNVENFQFANGTVSFQVLVNVAPEITTNGGAALALNINENASAGSTVIDIDASDGNTLDTLTWSITGGNAQGLFAIDPATGIVTWAVSPDYEALLALGATSQVLTVQVTDGIATDTQVVTVNILDVNEAPVVGAAVTLTALTEDMLRVITPAQLLANATDPEGAALTIQGLTASSGTILNNPDGTWTFIPALNDNTAVTFSYSVSDGVNSIPATATLDLLEMTDITGTIGNNAGAGALTGGAAAEQFHALSGNDRIIGNGGDDIIFGDAGTDNASGGGGNDTFVATIGDGNDTYNGNAGIDTYDMSRTSANAIVTLANGTGNGSASSSETGSNTLISIENVVGSRGNNTINGNNVANVLDGGFGNDDLNGNSGNDTLIGGFGNDNLTGGLGTDTMSGGLGGDTFIFSGNTGFTASPITTGNTAATRDVITDFEQGADTINLQAIDANRAGLFGGSNDAFIFLGEGNFTTTTTAAQLRYHFETIGGVDHTIIEGTVNATAGVDFQIDLIGIHNLVAGDFVL